MAIIVHGLTKASENFVHGINCMHIFKSVVHNMEAKSLLLYKHSFPSSLPLNSYSVSGFQILKESSLRTCFSSSISFESYDFSKKTFNISKRRFANYCVKNSIPTNDAFLEPSSIENNEDSTKATNSEPALAYFRRTPVNYLEIENPSNQIKQNQDVILSQIDPTESNTSSLFLSPLPSQIHSNQLASNPLTPTINSSDSSTNTQSSNTTQSQTPPLSSIENDKLPTHAKRQSLFPHPNLFEIETGYDTLTAEEVIEMLRPYIAEERIKRMEKVIDSRTYSLVPIVEGISDLGNVSAICRTSEALGFQSIQVISPQSSRRFKDNRKISMGTDKWIDVQLWDDTSACLNNFKNQGYRIVSTYISPDTIPIYDIDWTIPSVVVFGNEKKGISKEALSLSDIQCSIPMSGMVDSFNISVSVAIILHHIVRERINKLGYHGDLSNEEKKILLANFILKHKENTSSIIKNLITQKGVHLGQRSGKYVKKILKKLDEDFK